MKLLPTYPVAKKRQHSCILKLCFFFVQPFFDACLEFNNRIEAEKYVPRVLPENKVACFVKLGKFEDAAETAFSQKSEEDLDLVLGKCASSNRALANRIQEMKSHLRQRR